MSYLNKFYNSITPLAGLEQAPDNIRPSCVGLDIWIIIAMIVGFVLVIGLAFVFVKVARATRSDNAAERDLIDQKNDEIDALRKENAAHKRAAAAITNVNSANGQSAGEQTATDEAVVANNDELQITNDK